MFHLIVCGDSAGKTRTAIQEELVEMVGISPLHVGSGSNPNLSRSLHDFLGSSPGNLPISPKIEKGHNSTDPCYGFIAVDFPTMSDGQIAFEWELGTGWSELSRSGGHVVIAYDEKNGEMIEIGRTGSTEPLTDAFVLKNMDMDKFAELPDDVGVEYEVITINVNSCGSSTSEAWAAANSGG